MNIKNKGTLISIIALLAIFLPCTIIGMADHFKEVNKDHLAYYEGSMYFYDSADELIGTYKCVKEDCSFAKYKLMDTGIEASSSLIHDRYAFISDEETIKLVDVTSGEVISTYDGIYTYSDILKKNYYIVSKDGLYGIIGTVPTIMSYVEIKYSSIELLKTLEGSYTLNYILAKSDKNYILENGVEKYSDAENEILYGFSNFVVLKDLFNNVSVIDYDGNTIFTIANVSTVSMINNYIIVANNDSYNFYEIDEESENLVSLYKVYDLNISYEKEDDVIKIISNDEVIETIPLGIEN